MVDGRDRRRRLPDGSRTAARRARAPGPMPIVDPASLARAVAAGDRRVGGLVRGVGGGRLGQPRSGAAVRPVHAQPAHAGADGAGARRWALAAAAMALRCGATTGRARGATSQDHYDLGNDFYALWLDPGMTYSSALFAAPDQSLEEAQTAKLAAMLDRTGCAPGDRILEIGCGWGSFAEDSGARGRQGPRHHAVDRAEGLCRGATGAAGTAERDRTDRLSRRRRPLSTRSPASRWSRRSGAEYWPDYLAHDRARAEAGRARGDPVHRDRRRDLRRLCRATSISSSATSSPAAC